MKLHITARHWKLTPDISSYVGEKIGHLKRYFDHVLNVNVILGIEKYRHQAEIVVHVPRGVTLRAKDEASDMRSAIDFALSKIEIQLKKYKDRMSDRHSHKQRREEMIIPVKKSKQEVLLLSVEDAINHAIITNQSFFVFRDIADSKTKIVFQNKNNQWVFQELGIK